MGTDLTTKNLRQVGSVRELLVNKNAQTQLARVASDQLKPEKLMRLMAGALRTTPKLGECEPMSFLGALMECASLGLQPNTPLGHAWILPFDNNRKIDGQWVKVTEATVIVGYRGLIDLARRSGHITAIDAGIHYSDDEEWTYRKGVNATLDHVPGPQQGDKLHAYAIASFKDGGHAYAVYPWSKVMAIRDGSQGWQNALRNAEKYRKQNQPLNIKSPWATHEDEMAMKTMVRALAKYLPMSVDNVHRATQVDGAKLDYRQYAMDPESDPSMIEGTAAPIEESPVEGEVDEAAPDLSADVGRAEAPEAGQGDQHPPQEENPAEQPKEKAGEPKKGQGGGAASAAKGEGGSAGGADREQMESLKDRIMTDVVEAGPAKASEVMDLWRDQIAHLEKHAPDLKAEVDQAIASAIAGDGDEG